MNTIAIREKLHQYIDEADERKIEAMYIILEDEIAQNGYDNEEIQKFHDRRNKHLNGVTVSYGAEDSLKMIRSFKK